MRAGVRAWTVGLALAAAAPAPAAAGEGILAPGAEVTRLAREFSFTEGPTCDVSGHLYFTDQPNDRIMRWTSSGELQTFLSPAGRANGMYFDEQGRLLACADEKNELWAIDRDGSADVLWKGHGGRALNGPNDVWARPGGGVYFTDPFYKRPWWSHDSMPQDGQHVYYLAPDEKTLVRVTDDLVQPNGIIGSPDGTTLYVSDIRARRTWRYDIGEGGLLSGKTLHCEHGSDGMTLDDEGNVYLTGDGVRVFDRDGREVEHIVVPDEPWTANVSFCGPDRRTLFITASKGLYSVRTRTRGANAAK